MDLIDEHLPQTMIKAMTRIPAWFTYELMGRPGVTMESFVDDVSQGASLMSANMFYWSMLTMVNADRLGIREMVDGLDFDVVADMKTRFGPEFAERAVKANTDILTLGVKEELQ